MTWMQTHNGLAMDYLRPNPAAVCLRDIAHHLARIPRWTGATEDPWCVARHSLLVEAVMPADCSATLRLIALLHDAHEAYTGDFSTPLKQAIRAACGRTGLDPIAAIQSGLQRAIHSAFSLPDPDGLAAADAAAIKHADHVVLAWERLHLLPPSGRVWGWKPPRPSQQDNAAIGRCIAKIGDPATDFIGRFRTLCDQIDDARADAFAAEVLGGDADG